MGQAIHHIFPMTTEMAFIFWNGYFIPINYKYDISVCIDDIISCLEKILNPQSQKLTLTFGSDTFNGYWDIEIIGQQLQISAHWDSIRGLEKYVNNQIPVKLNTNDFVAEWCGILTVIDNALVQNRISLIKEQYLVDRMRKIVALNNNKGVLYRDLKPSPKTATLKTTNFRRAYEKIEIHREPDRIDT
ncbi:MAG: hypothetical protein MUC87_20395, partial [Bacteroidia bacterium]|nr:hypothetical protein [Bacteroidia bacterium]